MKRLLRLTVCVLSGVGAGCAQNVPPSPAAVPPPKRVEKVTVTADRGLMGVNDSAASVALLNRQEVEQHPGFALDDALRQVAGFQLFRRTSSWTANPTTQGVSLRGLGSTAASRTLVVSDEVPFNDAFGGWVHWNEVPTLAIDHVEVLRGGAADLYGSSAIGGVVDIVPRAAEDRFRFAADGSGASEDTAQGDALLSARTGRLSMLGAASGLKTNGYIPTAPAVRGSVDRVANVSGESERLDLQSGPFLLRGNMLNEARMNGTPLQTNGTRLWRFEAGASGESAHWGRGVARLYGSRETYRQTFSAIAADRNSERLTRQQRVPTDEFGVVLQGSRQWQRTLSAALGADLHDVRATDAETAISNGVAGTTTSIAARQREVGGYADAIWQPRNWSLSGSVRVDSFRTFDAAQRLSTSASSTALPALAEIMVSPRVGAVRRIGANFALTGTAFRAFRGPTMNELYRTGQVGQQTTLANNSLRAERATGMEFGGEWTGRVLKNVRATYFWTEVNRPISAVLLTQTPASQTLQRQNLGQIRSRGAMLEAETLSWKGLAASASYQFAVATVTAFQTASSAQRKLVGNWIPQVPRQSVTARLRWSGRRGFAEIASVSNGQQFDDAENLYRLHSFTRFDCYAQHELGRGLSLFAGAQNLLDRRIEAGKTPTPTLASPRIVQGGLRFQFGR